MSSDLPGYSPNDVHAAPRRRSSFWSLIGLGRTIAQPSPTAPPNSPQTYQVQDPYQQQQRQQQPLQELQQQQQYQQQRLQQEQQEQQYQQQQKQHQQLQLQQRTQREQQMHAQQQLQQQQQQMQQQMQQYHQHQQQQYHQQQMQQQQQQQQQRQRQLQQASPQQQQQQFEAGFHRSQSMPLVTRREGSTLYASIPQHPLTPMGGAQASRAQTTAPLIFTAPNATPRQTVSSSAPYQGEAQHGHAPSNFAPPAAINKPAGVVRSSPVRRGKQEATDQTLSPSPTPSPLPSSSQLDPQGGGADSGAVPLGVVRRPDLGMQIFPQSSVPRSSLITVADSHSHDHHHGCDHDHDHSHAHAHGSGTMTSMMVSPTVAAAAAIPSPVAGSHDWMDHLHRQIQSDVQQRVQQQVQESVNQSVQQHVQDHMQSSQLRISSHLQPVMTVPASPEALRHDVERRLEVLDGEVLSQTVASFQEWYDSMMNMLRAQQTFFSQLPRVQFLHPPLEANRFLHSQHVMSTSLLQFLSSLESTSMVALRDLIDNGMPELQHAAREHHDASAAFNQLKADFYTAVMRDPSRKDELQLNLQQASQRYATSAGSLLRLLQAMETKKALAFGESLQQNMEILSQGLARAAHIMVAADIPSPVHPSSEPSPQLEAAIAAGQSTEAVASTANVAKDRPNSAFNKSRDLSVNVAHESAMKITPPADSSYHSPPSLNAKATAETGRAVPSTVLVSALPAAAVPDHSTSSAASPSPPPAPTKMCSPRNHLPADDGDPQLAEHERFQHHPPRQQQHSPRRTGTGANKQNYPAGADVRARKGSSPPNAHSPINQSIA